MPNYKNALSAVAFIAMLIAVPSVRAQHDMPHIPPVINAAGYSPDLMQPFIQPGAFEHDLQFFAPFELESFDDRPPAPTGFYASFDRMYISLSNPESGAGDVGSQPSSGKFIWGNRISGGYMTEDDHGWDLTYMHIQGAIDDNGSASVGRSNFSQFYSIGLNKTFRKEMHYGSYVEPFIGVRYIYFSDSANESDIFLQHMRNQILGFQVGSRYFKQKGRWTLSADVRIMAAQNFQLSNVVDLGNFSQSATSDEFVPMGELRIESAYYITRDLSIRIGLELMHFGRGMNRIDFDPRAVNANAAANVGPTLALRNDQDLTFVGVAFGVEWNH